MRFDDTGLSLAHLFSGGNPHLCRGTSGIYGIIDQQIYRPEGGDAESGISVFSRISAAPSDRNLVDFFLDAGMVFSGMLPGRPDDKFGASFIYARMSDHVRALDRDTIIFTGAGQPLRDFETVIELSYQAVVRPGWSLQPVFQYVIHPGGNVPDPIFPNLAVRNGPLLGMRSTISY